MIQHKLKDCKGEWERLKAETSRHGGTLDTFWFYCKGCLAIVKKEVKEK